MKVLIIGGGIIGLTCAWRLAERGASVEVIDAGDLGRGASSAALGALWPASPLSNGPLQQLHRQSLWIFESFLHELQSASGASIRFRRLGRIEILNSPKSLAKAHEEAAAANASWPAFVHATPTMKVLSKAESLLEQPGLIFPSSSFSDNDAALLCRATAQVSVPDLLDALVRACQAAGVSLRPNEPCDTSPDVPSTVLARYLRTCDAVLVAAGARSPHLDPTLSHHARITPAKGQGIALLPPDGFSLRRIVKSSSIYLIPWEHEILVGSTTEPEAGYDESTTEEAREMLHASAVTLFPTLRKAPIVRHWAGLRPRGPGKGHPPVMGPVPDVPRLFLCAGHYKTGLGMAPIVGRLMTKLILDQQTPPELVPFIPGSQAGNMKSMSVGTSADGIDF